MIMILSILVAAVVTVALFTDLKERKIPNWLTFGAAFVGIAINTVFYGFEGLGASLLGWIVGVALLVIPYLMKGIGAGDVKLMGAIGALMGIHFVFYTMLWTALAGGLISIIYMLFHRQILYVWIATRTTSGKFVPYGIAIFAGTLVQLLRMNQGM